MKQLLSFIIIIILSVQGTAQIKGVDQVCSGDCTVYKIENGLGGPYLWSVDNGDLASNQGDSIYVCWTDVTSAEITIFDLSAPLSNNKTTLNVDVYPKVIAEIIFPLSATCMSSDSIVSGPQGEFPPIDCKSVCKNSTLTYFAPTVNNVNYTWNVVGGQIVTTNDNECVIEWGNQEPAFIQLNMENQIGCADSIRYCIELYDVPMVDYLVNSVQSVSSNICAGQSLDFTTISSDASDFYWFVDNGQTASGINAEFDFPLSGTYQVALVGSSICQCSDTIFHEVVVGATPGPEIFCGGTMCSGVEQNYYTDAMCSIYTWNVSSNGTVVAGGSASDNYISVIWTSGPEGTITLSTSGCGQALCAEATVLAIPVIDGDARISGPSLVCAEDQSIYFAPYYEGTSYNWSIEGNGNIVEGHGTNEIHISWESFYNSADTALIRLELDNCYLECNAVDEYHVDAKQKFVISGNQEICEGSTGYFNAVVGYNSVEVDWQLSDATGVVLENENNTKWYNPVLNYGYGIFEIRAIEKTGGYCNDTSTVFIEVIEKPDPIVEIFGAEKICLNVFQQYTVGVLGTNFDIRWKAKDGANVTNLSGTEIFYKWESLTGPYELEVEVVDLRTSCTSDEFTKTFTLVDDGQILASDSLCLHQLDVYEIDGGITEGIEWEVFPANAGVISDLKNGQIEIQWMEVGLHEVRAEVCSKIFTKQVRVVPDPVFSIIAPDVCKGELSDVVITAPADVTVEFFDNDSNLISTSTSFQATAGRYYAIATSYLGCTSKQIVNIYEFPEPNVTISTPGQVVFEGPVPSIQLYALASTIPYTYQWYLDGVPFGGNTDIVTINQPGLYSLIVTDHNGCTAESNGILVVGNSTPDPCFPIGKIEFVSSSTLQCNEFNFVNTSVDEVPGSLSYDFGDPLSGNNSTTIEDPKHIFTNAGFFPVTLVGLLENTMPPPMYCLSGYREYIEVPLVTDFDYREACAGEAMRFEERASFLPGNSVSIYAWDFGEPSSGVDNTSSNAIPFHTYASPGTYLVTLEITASTGCISTQSKLVEVLEPTPGDFDVPSIQCVDTGIKFIGPNGPKILDYWWDFDDPASGSANNINNPDAIHLFSASGNYQVSLTTENVNGCFVTVQKNIQISVSALSGNITADKAFPVCFGESVNLTAPAGGLVYLWSNGQSGQTISVDQPGLYSVTITDSQVCDYSPDALFVEQLPQKTFPIRGYLPDPNVFNYSFQLDSMEICEGDPFGFNTYYDWNVDILWPNGSTGFSVDHNTIGNLPVGRHSVELIVTDKVTGCEYPTKPFVLKVNEVPDVPVIVSDQVDMCEGKIFTFSIMNPDPNVNYYWSNQGQGNSVNAIAPGNYYVTAFNEYGCEKRSNVLRIQALPDAGIFNGGCKEVCFPDTFCLATTNQFLTYQWIHDGIPVPGPEGTDPDFIAQSAGDYQLIVQNGFGCIDSSEVLYLDPLPSMHVVYGKVFEDDNGNADYDLGEEIMENAELTLWANTVLLDTQLSDALGEYEFNNINENSVRVVLNGNYVKY